MESRTSEKEGEGVAREPLQPRRLGLQDVQAVDADAEMDDPFRYGAICWGGACHCPEILGTLELSQQSAVRRMVSWVALDPHSGARTLGRIVHSTCSGLPLSGNPRKVSYFPGHTFVSSRARIRPQASSPAGQGFPYSLSCGQRSPHALQDLELCVSLSLLRLFAMTQWA